jgi:hypothetical protein
MVPENDFFCAQLSFYSSIATIVWCLSFIYLRNNVPAMLRCGGQDRVRDIVLLCANGTLGLAVASILCVFFGAACTSIASSYRLEYVMAPAIVGGILVSIPLLWQIVCWFRWFDENEEKASTAEKVLFLAVVLIGFGVWIPGAVVGVVQCLIMLACYAVAMGTAAAVSCIRRSVSASESTPDGSSLTSNTATVSTQQQQQPEQQQQQSVWNMFASH